MADEYNRLAMYSAPADQVNMLAQSQLPPGHPSNMLRSLRDYIPENTSLPAPQFFMDPRSLSMANMLRGALETSANWLEGTHNPQAVRIGEDTIAPLGLFGMAGLAGRGVASARAMADNARSSVPGTVVNAMGEQPQTIRAYHGSPRSRPDGRFDESRIGYGEPGFFFTDDPWLASRYVKGDIAPMQVVKDAFDESLALGHMAPSPSGGTKVVNRAEHDALMQRRLDEWHPEGANVTPVDIDTSKLRTVDMPGYRWAQDYGRRLSDQSREARDAGFDGLRIRGMTEGNDTRTMPVGERPDVFTIWGRGNIRSATTGDTLFSGSSSSPGLAANATQGDSDSGVTDILRRYGLLD